MKTIFFLLTVAGLLTLWSCGSLVQDVDPSVVPRADPKLVVHSYISPQDTVLVVGVERSQVVFRTIVREYGPTIPYSPYQDRDFVTNATVDLSDGSRTVRLVYSKANFVYGIRASSLPIREGQTYTLTVAAPGLPTVQARCTVPASARPTEVRFDSTARSFGSFTQQNYQARLLWQDVAGQPNYYRVDGALYKTATRSWYSGTPNAPRRDTTITTVSRLFFDDSALYDDTSRDGGALASSAGTANNGYYDSDERVKSMSFRMLLFSLDAPYYRYLTTLSQQVRAGENPFAEPVPLPSNIEGGLGCFGAYNRTEITSRMR